MDHRGEIFGVSFPTKKGGPGPSDAEAYSAWSRMPNRSSDTEFVPQVRTGRVGRRGPEWQDAGPAHRAPWADDAAEGMLYVHAHAGPRGFELDANVGSDEDPEWQTLLVPGRFFGHVLASNTYFEAASRAGPRKPVLMLCCDAGDPRYGHAHQAAGVLHEEGRNHDVYATVGINQVRWDLEKGLAQVLVETMDARSPGDAVIAIRAPGSDPGAR